jgi:hypothetical protein
MPRFSFLNLFFRTVTVEKSEGLESWNDPDSQINRKAGKPGKPQV